MSGEILRAILTENTRTRRYKCYTTRLTIAGPLGAGAYVENQIIFDEGKQFLWTGTSGNGVAALATAPVQRDMSPYTLQYFRPNVGRVFSPLGQNVNTVMGSGICNGDGDGNVTGNYQLFDGDEILKIRLATTPALGAVTTDFYLTLSGIEYIRGDV